MYLFLGHVAHSAITAMLSRGPSWPWSEGSWIYNYLCNQCLSPLMFWVRTPFNEVYSIQHYVIKFFSDLRQVGGFLRFLRFPPPIKLTDCHDIIEILLKVALSTIYQTNHQCQIKAWALWSAVQGPPPAEGQQNQQSHLT